jgi:hypothetical protein
VEWRRERWRRRRLHAECTAVSRNSKCDWALRDHAALSIPVRSWLLEGANRFMSASPACSPSPIPQSACILHSTLPPRLQGLQDRGRKRHWQTHRTCLNGTSNTVSVWYPYGDPQFSSARPVLAPREIRIDEWETLIPPSLLPPSLLPRPHGILCLRVVLSTMFPST